MPLIIPTFLLLIVKKKTTCPYNYVKGDSAYNK